MAAEQMQGRFAALDEEEFQTLLDDSEAENTKRSTVTAVKAFRDYLTEKLFSADFENYNKEELDQKLSTFYHEMRNKKGKLYKKSTLISYRTGLQRHLEKSGSDFDIIKGVAFKKSIKSFKLMTKELKRQGLANVEHFPVICDEDLEKIYDHLTSNLEDAQLLQYKVFIDIMLHFGVRGRKNLSSLTRSHFDVTQNSEGAMYVYSTLDEKTKNQQDNKERSPGRRMYEIKECQKCPVRSFVKYIRRLNPRCDRLFQQPRKQPKDGVYYDNVALGHNKLGTFMNQISVRCGLTTIYTNHSCHATTAHVLESGQCLSRHMSVTVNKAESSRKTHCKKSDDRTKELLSEKIAERIKKKCISHSNTWTGKKIVPEDFSSMSTRQENGDSPSTFQDDPSSYPTFVYNPGVLLHMTCENVEPESQSGNGKEVICNIKQEPMDTYFEGESENSQQSKELSLDSQTSQCTSMSSLFTADMEIKVESDCQNHDQLSEGAWNSTHSNINSSIQVMGGNSDSVNTFSNTDVHSDNNIRNESQFSSDWKKNCLNDLKDTLKKTISGLEDLGAEVAAWVIIPNDNSSLIHHMGSKKGMEFILSKRNLDADLHLFLRNYGKQQSKRTEILQQPVQDLVNKETIYFPSHNQLLNNALLVSTKKDNPAGGPKGDNSENFCTRQSAIRGLKRKLSSTYSSCSNTDSQSTGEDSVEDSKDAMVDLCTKLVAEKYDSIDESSKDKTEEFDSTSNLHQPNEVAPPPKSRFKSTPSEDKLDTIASLKTEPKTQKQTAWGVKLFRGWLKENGFGTEFEELDNSILNERLRAFYASLQTRQGKEYSKSALIGVRAAIGRHLTSAPFNLKVNILRDREFMSSNQVLRGLIKILQKEGKDVINHKNALSAEDVQKLYTSGVLSPKKPETLQNKVFWDISLNFGHRGQEGLHLLTTKSYVKLKDANGREYYKPADKVDEQEHRMYAREGDPDCPVASLDLYLSKLSKQCNSFFQQCMPYPKAHCWYAPFPLGVNKLSSMMSRMSVEAGLSRRYTNHCIRATVVNGLKRAGVDLLSIMAVTGHKAFKSIEYYNHA